MPSSSLGGRGTPPPEGDEVADERSTRHRDRDFSRSSGAGRSAAAGPADSQAGHCIEDRGAGYGTASASGSAVRSSPGSAEADMPMSNYAFFVKYTYSNECALLAYNFHELVLKLGTFDLFPYKHDHRLISVTLAYILYRYQVHHCDMALDLALTLVYLEELRTQVEARPELRERGRDAFNLICYMAFLAHAFNSDRPIRLVDWFKEIGWRSFKNCHQLNAYVFFLFSQVRGFKLRVKESQVKRYIQKLCSVPNQVHSGF
eukprot:TRINITY_DN45575_c0_g1_i1.p1 TRINITY_DN45575_c0_g1~~TRINITY_DN45575_c0_g1_i1.p1  ORF type:complete len:260 (+),score=34.69 TRINITY_DN45575_c0_g1_i1:74-853(+)